MTSSNSKWLIMQHVWKLGGKLIKLEVRGLVSKPYKLRGKCNANTRTITTTGIRHQHQNSSNVGQFGDHGIISSLTATLNCVLLSKTSILVGSYILIFQDYIYIYSQTLNLGLGFCSFPWSNCWKYCLGSLIFLLITCAIIVNEIFLAI